MVIETPDGEVIATVRLAPTDVAPSSGRTEWVGLVMVLVAVASHPACIELRLGNIQVVNAFNDGRNKYVRDWLTRTDRDVVTLAWSLAEERQRRGFGGLVAIHIKAHAEDRKQRSQFTHHKVMNVRADELTHAITPSMPMYAVSGGLWWVRRPSGTSRQNTRTWVVERCTRLPEMRSSTSHSPRSDGPPRAGSLPRMAKCSQRM